MGNSFEEGRFKIICGGCGSEFEISKNEIGRHIECECGFRFVVDQELNVHSLDEGMPQGDVLSDNTDISKEDRRFFKRMAWRRWSARIIDYAIWQCPFYLLVFLAIKAGLEFESEESADTALRLADYFGYFVFDFAMSFLFGNTPGKSVMNLRVIGETGERLTFVQWCERELFVLLSGFWIVLWPIGFIIQYFKVSRCGLASYDLRCKTMVCSVREIKKGFDFAGIAIFLLFAFLASIIKRILFGS